MDIVAHALWTTAAATTARRRMGRPLHLGWAVFWGVFPDVFSFAIPATLRIWWYVSGASQSLMPDAHTTHHFQFVWRLYDCSHSLLVFAATFGFVWLLFGRPVLELFGWGLHILIDIPTHQGIFAPHFLWPLSNYRFEGIRWESHWFQSVNYGVLMVVLVWLWLQAKRTDPVGNRP